MDNDNRTVDLVAIGDFVRVARCQTNKGNVPAHSLWFADARSLGDVPDVSTSTRLDFGYGVIGVSGSAATPSAVIASSPGSIAYFS